MLPREDILKSLPHRYPFLFVDKIEEIHFMKSVIGYKNVTVNEPWVTGHFPNNPIFPGVLLIETAAQICGFIFYDANSNEGLANSYLSSVKDFKFLRLIKPGDQLEIRGEFSTKIQNFAEITCKVYVENVKVAQGTLRYYFENTKKGLDDEV
jgi:3-hydroxyacyl-[acyl-carrier-protein] dehydratase